MLSGIGKPPQKRTVYTALTVPSKIKSYKWIRIATPPMSEPAKHEDGNTVVLPLHGETLAVSRRKVETSVVQVSTVTQSNDALVDEALSHERVEIERVPVGRIVATAPSVREEGDVTIIPVLEETIVIEKRIVLKEEIRVRRVRVTEQHRETVVLREQEVVIKRSETGRAPES
jgi:uncharacterized protein (TIGR02271 family)